MTDSISSSRSPSHILVKIYTSATFIESFWYTRCRPVFLGYPWPYAPPFSAYQVQVDTSRKELEDTGLLPSPLMDEPGCTPLASLQLVHSHPYMNFFHNRSRYLDGLIEFAITGPRHGIPQTSKHPFRPYTDAGHDAQRAHETREFGTQ